LSVKYASGPILAGLGYLNIKDTAAGAPDNRANATLVYGGYDLGMAKVIAYFDSETGLDSTAKRTSVLGVKAIVPVTADLTVQAGVSKAKNIKGDAANNDDAVITAVKAVYKLSKRTSVYGIGTIVNNEGAVNKSIYSPASPATVPNGSVTGGIAAGVAHAF
jgi:predicted porin